MRIAAALCVLAATGTFAGNATAAGTANLPAWKCSQPDALFVSGFETGSSTWPSDPSLGTGGGLGDVIRTISVNSILRTFYLHVPSGYNASRAWPVLLVLHGQADSLGDAPLAALQARSDWSGWADSQGFIVVATVGTYMGGWNPSVDVPTMDAALNDTMARYNVEQNRIYLWGFSAGAHLAHALGLENTDYFAAYGVSAGALTQFACTDDGSYPPSCNALLGGDARKIPVDIHLGLDDPLYSPPYDAAHDPNRLENNGWQLNQTVFYTTFDGGHEYSVPQLGEIWSHLCPNVLVPDPN